MDKRTTTKIFDDYVITDTHDNYVLENHLTRERNFRCAAKKNDHPALLTYIHLDNININAQCSYNKNTALHLACYEGNLNIAETLLDNNAKVNIRNSAQLTPLGITIAAIFIHLNNTKAHENYRNMIDLLITHDAKIAFKHCQILIGKPGKETIFHFNKEDQYQINRIHSYLLCKKLTDLTKEPNNQTHASLLEDQLKKLSV